MELINGELKKVIKIGLIKKYIDELGLELPTPPTLPSPPTLPPLPSLNDLEESIRQLSASSLDTTSLYTKEYQEAWDALNEKTKEINEKYRSQLEEGNIPEAYREELSQARIDSGIDKVSKFSRSKNNKGEDNSKEEAERLKKDKMNKEKAEKMKEISQLLLKQQADWLKKETQKYVKLYNDTIAFFQNTVSTIKDAWSSVEKYFTSDAGSEMVDRECDKINRLFSNVTDSMAELSIDITSMISKIPAPDTLVAGAATGLPNPGLKIQVFMEDFKKVSTDLTKVINYTKEIISIAKTLGFAIYELIPAFKKMMDLISKNEKDVDKNFKEAVKEARKRQKWYLSPLLAPDQKKLAGFLYPDIRVDFTKHEIEVKGYRCYCKKDEVKVEVEEENSDKVVKKKCGWKEHYIKNGGEMVDSKGRRYYYLTEEDIMEELNGEDEVELLKELESEGDWYGDLYDSTTSTTRLSLSDGRTILIDYEAQIGDVIKLNDGSIIVVK